MSDKIVLPDLPYGEGTMFHYKDDMICYRKTLKLKNGQSVRKTIYGKSPVECIKKMLEAEHELESGAKKKSNQTLIDGIMSWLNITHKPTIKPQSFQRLVGTAKNQIEPSNIGHIRYSDVTAEEIQEFINSLNSQELSHSSIKKAYNLLGAFYKYVSARDGFNNPMLLVKMPKVSNILKETKEVEWFERDDIDKFIEACGSKFPNGKLKFRYGYALAANMFMGLRGGELLALQWKDIDFHKGTVYVCKTLIQYRDLDTHKTHFEVQNSTKRDNNRYVPINDKAKELLLLHRENSEFTDPDDYVISTANRRTNTIKNLSDMILKLEELGDTKVRAHNTHILRHTCASLYFRAGVRVEIICKILGNSREVCEKTYIHFVEEQLKDAASDTIKAINF